MNWQASLLANRTAFLKKVIDDTGLGAASVPLVTLNSAAARLTGSYRFASGDANTPASGVAGTVEVIAASASAVNQTAFDSASSRMWTRFWNGSVWSAWDLIWSSARGARSFGASGFTRLPDGTLLQYGQVTLPNTGSVVSSAAVTLPTAFASTDYGVTATPTRVANSAVGCTPAMGVFSVTATGFTMSADTNAVTTFNQTVPVRWHATGT
jgi:hypothetical protein